MWAQSPTQENTITPMKETRLLTHPQRAEIQDMSTLKNLNRPRQLQNKISRCLNFNSEMNSREIYNSNGEVSLSNKKLYEENYEEVIYSESESDDASFEDESSSPSGWIL